MKGDAMGEAYSTHGRHDQYVLNFSHESVWCMKANETKSVKVTFILKKEYMSPCPAKQHTADPNC
jgi:hypothetical protein